MNDADREHCRQALRAAAEAVETVRRENVQLRLLVDAMVPVVKAAVAWGKAPAILPDSKDEDLQERLAADLELSMALSGEWEQMANGCWRHRPGENQG